MTGLKEQLAELQKKVVEEKKRLETEIQELTLDCERETTMRVTKGGKLQLVTSVAMPTDEDSQTKLKSLLEEYSALTKR